MRLLCVLSLLVFQRNWRIYWGRLCFYCLFFFTKFIQNIIRRFFTNFASKNPLFFYEFCFEESVFFFVDFVHSFKVFLVYKKEWKFAIFLWISFVWIFLLFSKVDKSVSLFLKILLVRHWFFVSQQLVI